MNEQVNYNVIGNATTAATLTAAYTGNTLTLLSKYFNTLSLNVKYTPKSGQANRYIEIKVEQSNDDGTTWFGIGNKSDDSAKTSLYEDIPIKFPGDAVSTGGTAMTTTIDIPINADYVKVSVKESGSANFGTVYIQGVLKSDVTSQS